MFAIGATLIKPKLKLNLRKKSANSLPCWLASFEKKNIVINCNCFNELYIICLAYYYVITSSELLQLKSNLLKIKNFNLTQ